MEAAGIEPAYWTQPVNLTLPRPSCAQFFPIDAQGILVFSGHQADLLEHWWLVLFCREN